MVGWASEINGFPYSETPLHGLEASLSRERLGTILAASGVIALWLSLVRFRYRRPERRRGIVRSWR